MAPAADDWIAWGVVLKEALASGHGVGSSAPAPHLRSQRARTKPPLLAHPRRGVAPSSLVNTAAAIPAATHLFNTQESRASIAGLRVIAALCSSARLRGECSSEFTESLRIITHVLAKSIVGNPARTVNSGDNNDHNKDKVATRRTPPLAATPARFITESVCSALVAQNEHTANTAMTAEDADSCMRLRWAERDTKEEATVSKMESLLQHKSFKATLAVRRLQRISRRIDDKKDKLTDRKDPLSSCEQANEGLQWDLSVLEREISKARLDARHAEAKAVKMLREREFYAPECELIDAKCRGDALEKEIAAVKTHYDALVESSLKTAKMASKQEKRGNRVTKQSSRLRVEHANWSRSHTPRPKSSKMLPDNEKQCVEGNVELMKPKKIKKWQKEVKAGKALERQKKGKSTGRDKDRADEEGRKKHKGKEDPPANSSQQTLGLQRSHTNSATAILGNVAKRLSCLERGYWKRLVGLSADVRRAYQKDTAGGIDKMIQVDRLVQLRFKVDEETEASMAHFEDVLGGVASWSLRNSFLRIRVALDGAAAKLARNRRMCGWHRSEKIIDAIADAKPATIDVDSDIDDEDEEDPVLRLWNKRKAIKNGKAAAPTQRQMELAYYAKKAREDMNKTRKKDVVADELHDRDESPVVDVQLGTSDIVNRLAHLARVLKLIQATEESMRLREDMLEKAAELNRGLAEFDTTLESHKQKQMKRKKMTQVQGPLGGDNVDSVLANLEVTESLSGNDDGVDADTACAINVFSLGDGDAVPLFLRSSAPAPAPKKSFTSSKAAAASAAAAAAVASPKKGKHAASSAPSTNNQEPIVVISGVRKMNKGEIRLVLDKLWAARLGAVSASGGMSYAPLFMGVEARKRAAAIHASEVLGHTGLTSSSSEYDSDVLDPDILSTRAAKVAQKKELYNRILEERRHSTFLPLDEFTRNFFEDEAMIRWEKEKQEKRENQAQDKDIVPNTGGMAADAANLMHIVQEAQRQRRTRGLAEAYSFWWSAQLVCAKEARSSTANGITQNSCGVNFIRMSRLVLAGILPQEVIPDSMRMLRSVRTFVVAISRREMGVPAAAKLVYKDNLFASLSRFFPTATHEAGTSSHALSAVVDVIERENPRSCVVGVGWLFTTYSPDKNVRRLSLVDRQLHACRADQYSSPFLESILQYYLDGSTKYVMRLRELLYAMNPAGDGKLTPSMCAYCLHHVLSRFHVPRERVLRCMAIGMGLDTKMVVPTSGHDHLSGHVAVKEPMSGNTPFVKKTMEKKIRFRTKAAKILYQEEHAKQKRRKARRARKKREKAQWRALMAHPEAVVGMGLEQLPVAWMNELGSDQSTKRVDIDAFWRRLVSKHVYRPAKFYFPGAEPTLRHRETPDKPRTELSCVRVMLDGRGRSVYNNGRVRQFLAADKEGKSMSIVEAATTIGYRVVGCRTPRRRKNAEQAAKIRVIREEEERRQKIAAQMAERVNASAKRRNIRRIIDTAK
jgi:hypothetical protein